MNHRFIACAGLRMEFERGTAVSLFGERIHGVKPEKNKNQMPFSEKFSKAGELHLARLDIGRFSENQKSAETMKAQAESDLLNAGKLVKDLTLQIDESKLRASARRRELLELKCTGMGALEESSDRRYMEVLEELDAVKLEFAELKLDVASLLEEKAWAELVSKSRSCSRSVEALKKEVEDTYEEQVLIELARIEAVKEFKEIEAKREAEVAQFLVKMEKTRKRIKELMRERKLSKDVERKLAITNSDVDVLQNELKFIKAFEKHSESNSDSSPNQMNQLSKDESGNPNLLESAMAELEAAKKELSSIKEEGFQCMSAMDILRDRLRKIYEEMGKLKKSEEKADSTIQMLNSKLLGAKSKLESATTASKTAKAIASNLSAASEQLQTEKESMEKERELINEETKTIKAEMENAESKIELAEERLEAALQELESVTVSEGIALENLRALTEKTVTARASMCMQNSTITISRFEYEYLSSHAEGAKEIADKRVAAAQAWVEALKAGERETLGKIESCRREADEMRLMEEQERQKSEKLLKAKKEVERELHRAQKLNEATDVQIVLRPPRRSVKENSMTASRRRSARIHRPNLPGKYAPRSPSITLKKRTKVMPNLAKFFRGKRSKHQ